LNLPIKLDPEQVNIADDAWEFEELTEDFIVHRAVYERHANGAISYVYRKTPRQLTTMLEDNKRLLDESDGKRFGDGRVVGRIPLNLLFDPHSELATKIREGDRDHMKWWLNQSENKKFRTFRGTV